MSTTGYELHLHRRRLADLKLGKVVATEFQGGDLPVSQATVNPPAALTAAQEACTHVATGEACPPGAAVTFEEAVR